jgi:hypothetical protein
MLSQVVYLPKEALRYYLSTPVPNTAYIILVRELPVFDENILYSECLLPQIVDDIAVNAPDRLLGIIAKSSGIAQGFRKVTFKEFSHAVNYMAR